MNASKSGLGMIANFSEFLVVFLIKSWLIIRVSNCGGTLLFVTSGFFSIELLIEWDFDLLNCLYASFFKPFIKISGFLNIRCYF